MRVLVFWGKIKETPKKYLFSHLRNTDRESIRNPGTYRLLILMPYEYLFIVDTRQLASGFSAHLPVGSRFQRQPGDKSHQD